MTFEEFWKQNRKRYYDLAKGSSAFATHTAAEEAWDIKDNEIERWKTIAQQHNSSGCCCQIDENNGDPKMVEPCAFHAEWRDKELEALRGKYYDLIMCVGKKFPNETRHETAKRCIVEREQSSNCSVAVDRLQG